jgi:SAM-dependent methyltransferase
VPTLHQWIGKIFENPKGDVLEIGHVASSVSLELANLGFNVTAIDLRLYPFSHPKLKSLQGDFLKENFTKQFDCIFSLSTIEHFGISKRYGGQDEIDNHLDEDAFSKIAGLLKPSGKAIVSFPYAKSWVPDVWFRVYTRDELKKKLERVFTVEESRFYRRDNNIWTRVTDSGNDPPSPHDGVALFLLSKK